MGTPGKNDRQAFEVRPLSRFPFIHDFLFECDGGTRFCNGGVDFMQDKLDCRVKDSVCKVYIVGLILPVDDERMAPGLSQLKVFSG